MEYKYTDLQGEQIRIAHLLAGDGPGGIYIEISVKNIDEPSPNYNALSWQWGGQNEDAVIRIRDRPNCQGGSDQEPIKWKWMRVKPNLLDALKRLRNPDEEVRLWIDAICIQQVQKRGDNPEKSKQISMMTDIYKNASHVRVWLGEPKQSAKGETTANGTTPEDVKDMITNDDITSEDVKKAVKYINMLINLDDTNHIAGVDQGILDKAVIYDLEPLFRLLRRKWFSRRWIVQEISVNRNVQVHCGGEEVSWENLAYAVALLERVGRDGTINRILQKRPETRHVADYVGNISALPAYRLVQNKHTLSRMRGKLEVWEQTLEQLVCFLAVFQASYAHDTIYAILGIASDVRPVTEQNNGNGGNGGNQGNPSGTSNNQGTGDLKRDFVVDYKQEPLQVFKRFLELAIEKSQSLDILCRPWAPITDRGPDDKDKRLELPSWMPNIERKPFQATKGGKMVRYNSDPLVGAAVFRLKFYSASGLRDPVGSFFEIDAENADSRHITVRAFELSKVDEVFNSASFGNIPYSWLEAGGWRDGGEQPPDELWRTLVADRTHEGNKADPWYPMAFQSAAREKETRYGINTAELIHDKNNAAYAEVFRRVQAVVWNRRLIRTEGIPLDGPRGRSGETYRHLGLAPEAATRGDLIFVVLGCSVPLVLRPSPPPGDANRQSPGGTGSQPPRNQTGNRGRGTPAGTSSGRDSGQQGGHVDTYTLVGDCYIDDMMDGQAVAHDPEWKNFEKKIRIE
ncbi:hypothetical protein Hte_004942 [Hypoxylon texense]